MFFRLVIKTTLLIFLLVTLFFADTDTLVITGATIYPSPTEPAITNGVIVIRNGKITSFGSKNQIKIPEDASVIDCSGGFLTSGFQNSHVHFTEDKWTDAVSQPAEKLNAQLQEMLTRYGFTTVVDTGSSLENTKALRRRIQTRELKGPRILTAGSPLYPENGIPFYLKDLPPVILKQLATPATPEAAVSESRRRLNDGADIIKLFTGSWISRGEVRTMPLEIATAVVEHAHRNGKLVFSHASNLAGLEVALASRVDVIAHALDDDRGWTIDHAKKMKTNRMSMIPTLKLFSGPKYFQYILKEVGDFSSVGGQILFGTDVGYITDYDPTLEYVYMAQAGLNWQQILASLTTAPATRFNESNRRGRIAQGMEADLVVLGSDPSKDVKAFAKVQYTIRSGKVIYSVKPD